MSSILYFDGSTKNGWSYRLENSCGLVENSGEITDTSMVCEYHGLIKGLSKAIELGISDIEIRGDSRVVIDQILGGSKAKGKEARLRKEVLKLLELMPSISFNQIPRETNLSHLLS